MKPRELSTPLDKPGPWVFQLRNITRVDERAWNVTAMDRTWFGARAQTMTELRCGPDDLKLVSGPFVIIREKKA